MQLQQSELKRSQVKAQCSSLKRNRKGDSEKDGKRPFVDLRTYILQTIGGYIVDPSLVAWKSLLIHLGLGEMKETGSYREVKEKLIYR